MNRGAPAQIMNNTVLSPGTYYLTITVYDSLDNSLAATIAIIVEGDTNSPEWVMMPTNRVLAYGESLEMQLVAWDESGIDHWWINDTTNFAIDESGIIRNNTVLSPGTYSLSVVVFDPFYNSLNATFVVIVRSPIVDTEAPEWLIVPTDQVLAYGEPLEMQLAAWDGSGIDHWWLSNTVNFSIDEFGVIRNNTVLSPRVYHLTVVVYDTSGNSLGTDFSVTVVDEEGLPQPVSFDVVDLVDVFITIDISTAGTEQPVSENLADVVAEYVLQQAQANFSGLGQNQINFEYAGLVYDLQAAGQISGVTDVTVTLSDGGLPANPLPISIRERPEFDSANITVNVTP